MRRSDPVCLHGKGVSLPRFDLSDNLKKMRDLARALLLLTTSLDAVVGLSVYPLAGDILRLVVTPLLVTLNLSTHSSTWIDTLSASCVDREVSE